MFVTQGHVVKVKNIIQTNMHSLQASPKIKLEKQHQLFRVNNQRQKDDKCHMQPVNIRHAKKYHKLVLFTCNGAEQVLMNRKICLLLLLLLLFKYIRLMKPNTFIHGLIY